MSEYYAVTRSGEELAHYGVRGMKWGVRKAILTGNDKKLGKLYKKAASHLAKLEKRAGSKKEYQKRAAKLGAAAVAAGGLAGFAAPYTKHVATYGPDGKISHHWSTLNTKENQIFKASAGAVAAGLGAGAAYNAYRAATTKRAAKKANAYRRQLKETFAGTKYTKLLSNKVPYAQGQQAQLRKRKKKQ